MKIGSSYQRLKVKNVLGFEKGHLYLEIKCKCGNIFKKKNGNEFKDKSCGCLEHWVKGEKKGNSRFKNTDIISLRELNNTGIYTQEELANMFDVTKNYISRIVTRKIWKSI